MVWLLLLLCPLMMIFMMKGMHGGHGNREGVSSKEFEELKSKNQELSQELTEIKSKMK